MGRRAGVWSPWHGTGDGIPSYLNVRPHTAVGSRLAGFWPGAPSSNTVTMSSSYRFGGGWHNPVHNDEYLQERRLESLGGANTGRGEGGPVETWPRDSVRGNGGRQRHCLPLAWGLLSEDQP